MAGYRSPTRVDSLQEGCITAWRIWEVCVSPGAVSRLDQGHSHRSKFAAKLCSFSVKILPRVGFLRQSEINCTLAPPSVDVTSLALLLAVCFHKTSKVNPGEHSDLPKDKAAVGQELVS